MKTTSFIVAFVGFLIGFSIPAAPAHGQWSLNGVKVYYNAGNVGVGTSNPAYKLDVRTSTNARAIFAYNSAAAGTMYGLYSRSDSTAGFGVYGLANATSGTNFGVYGRTNSTTGRALYGMASAASGVNFGIVAKTNSPDGFAGYFAGGRNYFGGSVGLGITNPRASLDVVGEVIFRPIVEIQSKFLVFDSSGASSMRIYSDSSSGAAGDLILGTYPNGQADQLFLAQSTGYVGVGDSDPSFRLELPNIADNDGQARANAWMTYSSIRWKRNVQPIENALDKVLQLHGVSFDWNSDESDKADDNGGGGSAHDLGFIAEEVGRIVPELVVWEDDGVFAKGMKYDRVTALLVEAIRDLRREKDMQMKAMLAEKDAQVLDQQRQIDELARRLTRIQAALDSAGTTQSKGTLK